MTLESLELMRTKEYSMSGSAGECVVVIGQKPVVTPTNDDASKKEELQELTEKFGTKMAYLIFYLRYLFRDSPRSRVIVFSQVSECI